MIRRIFISEDKPNFDCPLEQNPFREQETKYEMAKQERDYTRLCRDAERWRDPSYRTIMSMKYNKGENK